MRRNMRRVFTILLAGSVTFVSCGARLPKVVTKNRPIAVESPLDLNLVNFKNLRDETTVNLGQYMDQKRLKFLVLTFGSKGCGVCMEKARFFQANLVNENYQLLGDDARSKVELIGVSTDSRASRDELLALIQDQGLSHLSWSDAGHIEMMRYFQPSGRDFSVPLTVMLNREGIVWRVTSDQHLTPSDLILKIAGTLGSDVTLPPPIPEQPVPKFEVRLLAREVPDRLSEVNVSSCRDRSIVNLGALMPAKEGGLRAVLVTRDGCASGSDCDKARQEIESWQNVCVSEGRKECSSVELLVRENDCASASRNAFAGGKEIYDVFADHFNWSYKPVPAGVGRIKLPEVAGPLTLIFDQKGRLVFGEEGGLNGALLSRMRRDGLEARSVGPDFALAWRPSENMGSGLSSFSQARSKPKYTLTMFWNTWCSSCIVEIEEWHKEMDSAYNFCRERPEFCQVIAVETGQADSGSEALAYLNGLVDGNADFEGWTKKMWTMPLAVENNLPTRLTTHTGLDSLESTQYLEVQPPVWFAGWVRARFGSSEPRTVLYDQEGKAIGAWKSLPGEHGPRDAIRSLFEQNQ